MDFRVVCFDLDGTLLDTLDDLADSMNATLEGLGLPQHPKGAYRIMVGDGMAMLARRSLPEHRRDEVTVADTLARMRSQYALRWAVNSRPYAGIDELLRELSRRGVACAVLSNKPHDFTRMCVEKLLAEHRFAVVQGVQEGVPPKPDPSGALGVARRLGVSPDQVLYVGDTDTDMETARAAGMFSLGVTWGFRDEAELRQHGAGAILHHPLQLLDWLDGSD